MSMAPSVISCRFHTAPSRQTAKINYGNCDSGISGRNLNVIYVVSFFVLKLKRLCNTQMELDGAAPFFSSTVCVIQWDFSQVEEVSFFFFFLNQGSCLETSYLAPKGGKIDCEWESHSIYFFMAVNKKKIHLFLARNCKIKFFPVFRVGDLLSVNKF